MKFIPVPWDEVEAAGKLIASDHIGTGITAVYGRPRGGLVLAVIVSHYMGIPLIDHLPLDSDASSILWVDDIIDSGKTIEEDITKLPELKTAAMYRRAGKHAFGAFTVFEAESDWWLVFPWEDLNKAQQDMETYEASRK